MPTMINCGKELLRISSTNAVKLECSTNAGRNWILRYNGNTNTGIFSDLMNNGKEILGTTSKGLFYSTNEERD